jgi:uncharacterized membrane protein YbhN (UPF0104 family)
MKINILSQYSSSDRDKKKVYSFTVKLIISTGLILFLVYKINLNDIILAVKNADALLIGASFFLMFINIFLQYIKWKTAADKILGKTCKKEIFISLFNGLAGGAFTPARLGEYWGRSVAIKNRSFIRITAATLIDKLFPLCIVLIAGIIGTSWFYLITGKIGILIPVTITLLLLIAIPVLLFNSSRLLKLFSFLEKISLVKKNHDIINTIVNLDISFILKMTTISGVFFFCYILQYAILAAAFSHNLYIGKYLLAGIMVMFSKTLFGSVSLSEFGIREGASVYFLSLLGESSETGFNASLFIFIINIMVPSLFGLITMTAGKNEN